MEPQDNNNFQIPDFDIIPPPDIDFSGERLDHSYNGTNDEQIVYDPLPTIEAPESEEPCGWNLIYPDSQSGNPLTIGAQPAKVFFPHSDGEIRGVMPTLQDTGEDLDHTDGSGDLDRPSHTISGSGEWTQYLVYDSTNDTARIYFAIDTDTITNLILGTEKAVAIATFEVAGGEITKYELDICGPEMLGGGGAAAQEECKPFGVTMKKPAYLPDDTSPVPEGSVKLWMYTGVANDMELSNYASPIVVSDTTYFKIRVDFNSNSDAMQVINVEYVTGATSSDNSNVVWGLGDPRPTSFYVSAGVAFKQPDGNGGFTWSVFNYSCGSIVLSEHITRISRGSGNSTEVQKQITYIRLNS